MFNETSLKLYFMKCSERKVSQCILALRTPFLRNTSGRLLLNGGKLLNHTVNRGKDQKYFLKPIHCGKLIGMT